MNSACQVRSVSQGIVFRHSLLTQLEHQVERDQTYTVTHRHWVLFHVHIREIDSLNEEFDNLSTDCPCVVLRVTGNLHGVGRSHLTESVEYWCFLWTMAVMLCCTWMTWLKIVITYCDGAGSIWIFRSCSGVLQPCVWWWSWTLRTMAIYSDS